MAMNPAIAPVADEVMKGAGYQRPNPGGDDPNFPTAGGAPMQPGPVPSGGTGGAAAEPGVAEVQRNTSPEFPPVPQEAGQGMQGIETPAVADNLPA